MAWKSVTTPASMPLTTDYYPQKPSMVQRFVCSSGYDLIFEEIREEYGFTNYDINKKISITQVFNELVGQRLAMGFQIVVPKHFFNYNNSTGTGGGNSTQSSTPTNTANSSISNHLKTLQFI